MLEGRVHHQDSRGHEGVIGPGGVQWMTAGSGIVHSEMPDAETLRDGGVAHGFQLWVNLPRAEKMREPRYQEIPREQIPEARSEDGKVRVKVIAGESLGARAVIDTVIPITYLHVTIDPGGRLTQALPRELAAFVYAFAGSGEIGGTAVEDGQMAVLRHDRDEVTIAVPEDAPTPLEALLVAGEPLREPVARYGPFVMNTREEILQAVADFESGKLG